MSRQSIPAMVKRLERIRDLAGDLARDLSRDHGDGTEAHRAIIEAIRCDADALHRVLNPPKT